MTADPLCSGHVGDRKDLLSKETHLPCAGMTRFRFQGSRFDTSSQSVLPGSPGALFIYIFIAISSIVVSVSRCILGTLMWFIFRRYLLSLIFSMGSLSEESLC